jgi:hypothetical protein
LAETRHSGEGFSTTFVSKKVHKKLKTIVEESRASGFVSGPRVYSYQQLDLYIVFDI